MRDRGAVRRDDARLRRRHAHLPRLRRRRRVRRINAGVPVRAAPAEPARPATPASARGATPVCNPATATLCRVPQRGPVRGHGARVRRHDAHLPRLRRRRRLRRRDTRLPVERRVRRLLGDERGQVHGRDPGLQHGGRDLRRLPDQRAVRGRDPDLRPWHARLPRLRGRRRVRRRDARLPARRRVWRLLGHQRHDVHRRDARVQPGDGDLRRLRRRRAVRRHDAGLRRDDAHLPGVRRRRRLRRRDAGLPAERRLRHVLGREQDDVHRRDGGVRRQRRPVRRLRRELRLHGAPRPICDGTAHVCRTCSRDAECPSQTPVCTAAGTCAACAPGKTGACPATQPVCDGATSTCRACAGSSECGAATPLCLPSGGLRRLHGQPTPRAARPSARCATPGRAAVCASAAWATPTAAASRRAAAPRRMCACRAWPTARPVARIRSARSARPPAPWPARARNAAPANRRPVRRRQAAVSGGHRPLRLRRRQRLRRHELWPDLQRRRTASASRAAARRRATGVPPDRPAAFRRPAPAFASRRPAARRTPTAAIRCPAATSPAAASCVQCLMTADCAGGLVCDPGTHTCLECTPAAAGACSAGLAGASCLPGGQCGCTQDADCGSATSGRVCDVSLRRCVPGCRGGAATTGSNGCPVSEVCSSTTVAIGVCHVVAPPADGGAVEVTRQTAARRRSPDRRRHRQRFGRRGPAGRRVVVGRGRQWPAAERAARQRRGQWQRQAAADSGSGASSGSGAGRWRGRRPVQHRRLELRGRRRLPLRSERRRSGSFTGRHSSSRSVPWSGGGALDAAGSSAPLRARSTSGHGDRPAPRLSG